MPRAQTERFGVLEYAEESTLLFPRGLPGFESCRRFVLLDDPRLKPLLHLQSLERPELCFLAVPVRSIEPEYETTLSEEDKETLGREHPETLDLTLLSAGGDGELTANLLAPVVIDLATQRGVQAVRWDARYSHRHAVGRLCW